MHLTPDQIQVLLVEKLSGTITPEDDALIEQLLANDPELREQWLRLQEKLTRLGGSPAVSEEEAWKNVQANMLPARNKPRSRTIKKYIPAAAASLIILMAGVALLWNKQVRPLNEKSTDPHSTLSIAFLIDNGERLLLQHREIIQLGNLQVQADPQQMTLPKQPRDDQQPSNPSSDARSNPASATLFVPSTLNYKLSLSDGTEVWLNSQSHLRFPLNFQGSQREVFLQGEAYFKVSKDAEHPFIVHTGKTEVLVVGTEFNLNTYDKDSIATALVAGTVITRDSSGNSVPLHPGMQSVYSTSNGFQIKPFEETATLSWLKGLYYFHDTPLKSIANVLSRWYNVESEFSDPHLQDITFSGQLTKSQSLQAFLDNLNLAKDMHAYTRDGKIIFR